MEENERKHIMAVYQNFKNATWFCIHATRGLPADVKVDLHS